MNYRKDIDGLRAIAVLLVIFCHLDIWGFAGGFLGVDIFFVISGFLITSNIVTKLNEGRFSFKGFYINRIKRIAPVLIVILLLLTVFNVFVLLPDPLKNYLDFLPYVTLGLGNYAAADLSTGYFDAVSERYQLLHTWSLGVEEQFYLIVPVLFFLIWKIRNIAARNILILFIYLISIAISIYFVEFTTDVKANYYLLHTRFFEIFSGSMLAVFYRNTPNINSKLGIGLGYFFSILGLFYFSYIFNGQSSWPGINALIVSLITVLIIYLGKAENTGSKIKWILEHNAVRLIGKISYSLYLWHWIIIATMVEFGYDVNQFSILEKLALLFFVMIPISYLSWKFIENTFRYRIVYKLRYAFALWVLLPFLCFIGLYKYQESQPEHFYPTTDIDDTTYKFNHIKTPHLPISKNPLTVELYKSYKRSEYFVGDFRNKQNHESGLKVQTDDAQVLILANSHFHAFKDFVHNQLKEKELIGHVLHESNPKVYGYKNAEKIYRALLKGKKFVLIWVRPDPVNLGKTNVDWRDWMIQEALKLGVKPIVYVSGLELGSANVARKYIYANKVFGSKLAEKENRAKLFSNIPSLKETQALCEKYLNKVRWIDMKPLMCKNDSCELWSNETFALFDKHHITRSIGVNLGKEYGMEYGNMFSDNWVQPKIFLNSDMFVNEASHENITEKGFSGQEQGYEYSISFTDKRIVVKKTYNPKNDDGTMFFFHVFPENLEDLPPNRQKHGFTNLDVKGKVMNTFFNDESIFYGFNQIPDYGIKSINIGHFKPKGDKYFEKRFLVKN
ncbi:MAG: acyltransferase [Maribacter sp.]|nr:acyltransferase [Maribacter sp.]